MTIGPDSDALRTETTVIFGLPDFSWTTSPTLKARMGTSARLERASIDTNRLVLVDPVDTCLQTFEVGARVRLRSGGPTALVVDVKGDDVTIAWLTGEAPLEARFNVHCLAAAP